MEHYLTRYIQEDLRTKIVLLTGPRQTGKCSLSRDLQCSDKTVKRWLTILENMYVIFKVPPFHKNIARAIQKEIHFQEDCFGETKSLYYLRNKDGKEFEKQY